MHSQQYTEDQKNPTVTRKKVYMSLPFTGNEASNTSVENCPQNWTKDFTAAQLRIHLNWTPIIRTNVKDRLPSSASSFCVYNFHCLCGTSYIDRTARRLSDKVEEHCPSWFRNGHVKSISGSVLAHLVDSNHNIDDQSASRHIYRGNSQLSQPIKHRLLAISEVTAIRLFHSSLCRKKLDDRPLLLPWPPNNHTRENDQSIVCSLPNLSSMSDWPMFRPICDRWSCHHVQ